MKEEFHVRFVVNLQILYKRKMLVYFNNRIAITFDLANRGQPINWCSIVLTHLLVKPTCWIEHHKKVAVKLDYSKTKIDNYYSGPILDILFRKRFPISDVPPQEQ
jgi:hypothetical protein